MKRTVTSSVSIHTFFNSMEKKKKFNLLVFYTKYPVRPMTTISSLTGLGSYTRGKMSHLKLSTPNHKSSFLHKIHTEISLELLPFWLLFFDQSIQ